MREMEDMQLVQEYAARNSEEAFSALVARHLDLVYSSALRQVRNPEMAQEVAQAVFLLLAQKARTLGNDTILPAWLYRTARYASMSALRTEHRRLNRQQEVVQMASIPPAIEAESSWEQIAPLLDEAMHELNEKDRTAVVLHFFENKSLREVGQALGTNDDAAQKRVSRAVDKLRACFTRRKALLSAATLGSLLAAQAVQAAPTGLTLTIAAAAGAHTAATTSSLILIKATLKLMAWTKTKTILMASAAMLLALGTATVTWQHISSARVRQIDLQGYWEGVLQAGADLRIGVKVSKSPDGAYSATVDSIDQGAKDIPVSEFSYTNRVVNIEMKSLRGNYQGTLNPNGTEISGSWTQLGRNYPVTLKRTTPPPLDASIPAQALVRRPGSDLQGYWKATLAVGPLQLRLLLKISESTNGTYKGTIDSVDQGAKNIPITDIVYTGPGVELDLAAIGGHFEGDLNKEATEMSGRWMQGGQSLPLVFKRAEASEPEPKATEGSYAWNKPSDLQGIWNGTLDANGVKLRLAVNVAKGADGTFTGTMDSLDQGAKGVPATSIHYTNSDVVMEWKGIGGTYRAKLADGKLTGTFHQGPASLPLAMVRSNPPTK